MFPIESEESNCPKYVIFHNSKLLWSETLGMLYFRLIYINITCHFDNPYAFRFEYHWTKCILSSVVSHGIDVLHNRSHKRIEKMKQKQSKYIYLSFLLCRINPVIFYANDFYLWILICTKRRCQIFPVVGTKSLWHGRLSKTYSLR